MDFRFKNLKENNLRTKSLKTFANLCDFHLKKSIGYMDLKIYRKSIV